MSFRPPSPAAIFLLRKLLINGEYHTLEDALSITELLEYLAVRTEKGVAVALNFKVVSKSLFDSTIVVDGDQVDIIHATAGG